MDQFERYAQSRKHIINIIAFLVIMGILTIINVAAFTPNRLLFSIFKLAFLTIAAYYLLEGKRWAVIVISIVSTISILQGLFGLTLFHQVGYLVFNVGVIIGFGFIVWYLNSSKQFDEYIKLVKNGAHLGSSAHKKIQGIIDDETIVEIEHKKVTTPEAYVHLCKKLIEKASIRDQIVDITAEEGKVSLETNDTVFEISYNNSFNIFDRNFINAFNAVLGGLNVEKEFFYIYPEGILKPSDHAIYVAQLSETEFQELSKNGYLKI